MPPTDASTTSRQTDKAWINKVRTNVNLAQPMALSRGPCTIFKVPEHIRQLDPQAYKPAAASLGPFHHNWRTTSPMNDHNWRVTSPMNDHKWRCVRHLLSLHRSRDRASQLLNKCLLELKKHDEKVRSCYSEEFSKLNAQDMAEIMFLDGCFILYLMVKNDKRIAQERGEEEVGMLGGEATEEDETREGEVDLNIKELDEELKGLTVVGPFYFSLVVYDLLKLENQIPFFIIQLLFDRLIPCEDGQINLVGLALRLFQGIRPRESKSFNKKSSGEYYHLLHLFYSSRIPLRGMPLREMPRGYSTYLPKWIPSATELKREGVKFEKKEAADSFLNINFQIRKMKLMPLLCPRKLFFLLKSGRMKIPQLQIYDYTGPLFRNLIAFEQCYFDTEMYLTIYALFMDCIIDQAQDVRLLRLEGILQHRLNNDEEVADLFNKLSSQIYYVSNENYLANQIEMVYWFYDFKWPEWLLSLRQEYCGSPWATISVLAAAFLLLLTSVQTVFSVLSYFHYS